MAIAFSGRWVWSVLWVGVGVSGLLGACQGGVCSAMGCVGSRVQVDLVDEQGMPVQARGEFRDSGDVVLPFDCHVDPDASPSDLNCVDGTVHLDAFFPRRGMFLDVRWKLESGDYSEWQAVPLAIAERVIKDFNGPDCDCTVHEVSTAPVEVPIDAQLGPEPDEGPPDAGPTDGGSLDQPDAMLSDGGGASIMGDSAPVDAPDATPTDGGDGADPHAADAG